MYRPAGYDDSDEDDFDDFGYMSSSYPKQKQNTAFMQEVKPPEEDYDTLLYYAILDGQLDETKRIIRQDTYLRGGGMLRQGWPAMFYACFEAQLPIVEYFLRDEKMDVNRQYNLQTALMIACSSSQSSERVYQVVRLLLDYGAIIGMLDQYGCSPLMLACKAGHLDVVKEIVGESSLLSTDNEGNTALFYAVNNNHLEIVKILLRAGAQTHTVNRQGFTPRQCAINQNYLDIAELFPSEEKPYVMPAKYLCYSDYHNFMRGERADDPPGYFPDLGLMLFGMNSEGSLRLFADANMNLFEFLTVTDERLLELGMKYPIERKRVLLGLYDFHLHKWSRNSLWTMEKQRILDFYDIMEVLANILKHLTVMQASLLFTKRLTEAYDSQAFSSAEQSSNLKQQLVELHSTVKDFAAYINTIHEVTAPKPVLYIMPSSKGRQRNGKLLKMCSCLFVGGMLVYLKLRW
ncbi:ankyrin repeat, SAM and basic leucine zipper domain-containing protein 1 isoform X2 [Anopheles arabiensis]|nr:ankyrin repeat, SAM and basic leucine zipper domain-containing protein 1 isoform X2 [Anopheles arabiensis]XP_040170841.1 ankyrin repeat, SAM and basic leucine zipper domain-containing protein 1 isoform X2 [Anopheles arabiensis]